MNSEFNDNQIPKNLINIITFNVRATRNIGDDGVIPWVNIGRANEEILNLIDADEIVIEEKEVRISIDYPIENPTVFTISSKQGFSRKILLIAIREKHIELAQTALESFDIDALDLVSLDIYKTNAGEIEITLEIDS